MGERRGTKALELWCRRITEGYPGVKIENMTTSWRDGLAFCAMIHHFKPDLIEFEKLNKNDIYYNNDLAFRTAEAHLGIPALLDADDMATYEVPDRLSILTYLSQFYQVFAAQDSTNRLKRSSTSTEKSSISKTPGPPPKMAHIVGVPKREPCRKCSLPVFLAERVNVGKNIYHRTCLKCARCKSQLSLGSFYETEIDGEFCCETCPDEESNIDDSTKLPTATTSHSDENVSPNKSISVRSSIADRLAFFERSSKDNQLLQKSVSDEEKSKSLKKIAEQYKPNAALANFMNSTLGDSVGAASDLHIEPDEISTEDNSKCDTTIESSDEENENIFKEEKPPALPKDGPPMDYNNDDDVLSVVVESHSTANNNAIVNEKEQKLINDNAPNFISNAKVLLTSPSNKIINTTQNHHNIANNNNNNNNIYDNDLNLSSKVTKDISNIQNDDLQTGTTMNTKPFMNITSNASTNETDVAISLNVELRNKVEPLKEISKLESAKTDSNIKIDPTEQRLSVVRSRLQQFEEVLKSEEDANNSKKSTISISSSNKVNNIGNSKLVDKSVTNITEENDESGILNLTGNEVPNENTIIIKESIKIQNESRNELKPNELEQMDVDLKSEGISSNEVENQTEVHMHEILEKEIADEIDTSKTGKDISIKEQIKLSEDDKQTAVINEKNKSDETVLTLHTSSKITLKNKNDEINAVEISEEPQINLSTQGDNTEFLPHEIILDKKTKNNLDHMAIEISHKDTTEENKAPTNKKTLENKARRKSDERNEYPDELNPFASDDDDENNTESNRETEVVENRRKSLNPFDSSDEDENSEKVEGNNDVKLKPPRPPPPKISKNPFGSESEEENEGNADSGSTSLVSMGSGKRAPVPTPRSQLTPSHKRNLTPEPTPRSARQSFSADSRLGSSEYYGSNVSLNNSLTSPNGKDSFYRQHDTRSSNNSLASSAGGSSGVNTIKSRKKKAPAPPPPTVSTGVIPKVSKELCSPNDTESKKSTPASSTSTTPQMARKKRPAPKPPTGLISPKKDEKSQLTENVPQSLNLSSQSENESSSATKSNFSTGVEEAVAKTEIGKLSDEEKVAHLDGRQFFLEETSTSNKVPEIYQKENKTLKETPAISESTQQIEVFFQNDIQKTRGVECSEIKINKTMISQINSSAGIDEGKLNIKGDSCILDPSDNEVSHDRHIEKIKDNKESKNRNRQSQHYNDDIHSDPLFNKSVHGKWKRRKGPAPSLPVPPRKILQMLPLQEIRHELEIIEVQQQGLEKQGVILETMIRERCEGKNGELINPSGTLDEKQPNSKEVEDLILQLFELVNEKNELFRRQAELMYLRRQHRLEQEQADLEYEIRVLMAQPERNKTDSDKAREEALIARLVEVVQLRNEVIECLEMDRLREAEEDLSIKQRLEMHTAKRDEELCKQTPTKLSKKEKKKQKESKKLGKSKKLDADKDADETEINAEAQKKKKKRKFLFSVLTSSKAE